jgi:hypothetical protein
VRTGFWGKNLKEGDLLENPSVDGWIILKWIFLKWGGGMDWIDLAKDRNRWRAVVNFEHSHSTHMRFHKNSLVRNETDVRTKNKTTF